MNNNPPVPDELIMFDKQFSWRTSWKVCHWWLITFLISAVFDVIFPEVKKQWPAGDRAALVFTEFTTVFLFIRDAKKWIRSMDELQRRITTATLFFSVIATFLWYLLCLRLEIEGFFDAIYARQAGNDIWRKQFTIAEACVWLGCYYGIGFLIFKRRYK